jgi:hypothetical protein
MKKVLIGLFILSMVSVSFTSCSKDEEEPEWSFLYGEWMPAGEYEHYGTNTHISTWLPNQIRLTFSRSGYMTFSRPEKDMNILPWTIGTYKFKISKDKDGELYLEYDGGKIHKNRDELWYTEFFDGNKAHIWYVAEEDALYYNFKGYFSHKEDGETYTTEVDEDYIFKRAVEKNMRLSIQDRDKNLSLMQVKDMPEWLQKKVNYTESEPYIEGTEYSYRRRIHQFKCNGLTYYSEFIPTSLIAVSYTNDGEYVVKENSPVRLNEDAYSLYWYTTDWKLVYIFPCNY